MPTPADWNDEYWLPLLQLYMRKPTGVKPIYSRPTVELSLELHVPPETLYAQMRRIRELSTPSLRRLWDAYAGNRRRLGAAVRKWRRMQGFGSFAAFYDGVEVEETFERDFRPMAEDGRLIPVMLIMALDLYFRLTPNTMVADTPEVTELARTMRIDTKLLVEVMREYLICDPCMPHGKPSAVKGGSPKGKPIQTAGRLHEACQTVWRRFSDVEPQRLAAHASLLREYFKTGGRAKRVGK